MPERKRSVVWSYITAVNENAADCDVCRKAVHYCGSTTNVFEHAHTKKSMRKRSRSCSREERWSRRRRREMPHQYPESPNTETDFTGRVFREARNIQVCTVKCHNLDFVVANPFFVAFLCFCGGAVKRTGVVLLVGIELLTPSFVCSLHVTLHLINWYKNLGFWFVTVTCIRDSCAVVQMQKTTQFYMMLL